MIASLAGGCRRRGALAYGFENAAGEQREGAARRWLAALHVGLENRLDVEIERCAGIQPLVDRRRRVVPARVVELLDRPVENPLHLTRARVVHDHGRRGGGCRGEGTCYVW